MEAGTLYTVAAISIMLVVTASQAVGALLARREFARLADLAEAFTEETDLDTEDKRLASSMMSLATAWYTTPLLLVAMPIVSLFVQAKAVWLTVHGRPLSPESIFGKSAKAGRFSTFISSAMFKARPLVCIWMIIWAVPALLVLAVLGAVRLAPDILRRSIEAILSRAVHQ